MNKIYSFLILLIFIISSCKSSLYQVSIFKSNDVKPNFEFSNQDLSFKYNFWSLGGSLNFSIHNKTDLPLYIHWENSNFIFNDFAYDYFDNTKSIKTKGVYNSKASTGLFDIDYNPRTITPVARTTTTTVMSSNSKIKQEKKIIQIPPKSYINAKTIELDLPWLENMNENNNVKNFDAENSILNLRTYIAYSFNKDVNSLKFVDNAFWINQIIEMNSKDDKYKGHDKSYNYEEKLDIKKTILAVFSGIVSIAILQLPF